MPELYPESFERPACSESFARLANWPAAALGRFGGHTRSRPKWSKAHRISLCVSVVGFEVRVHLPWRSDSDTCKGISRQECFDISETWCWHLLVQILQAFLLRGTCEAEDVENTTKMTSQMVVNTFRTCWFEPCQSLCRPPSARWSWHRLQHEPGYPRTGLASSKLFSSF